ncbi:T9SS type A sorting domain-containing protein [Stygiobacter electus]|uniref:T9SS type A sorting domain-containing protein n=1 Tax=Stygiobacter electus TaxID=3032292 RepID=A0AAE3P281_9BACT|nr:T9SS type A sorting domain-containing protein [Stygiobacter electus]MDF1612442.1 T9SS type A sorting domain-containing protein [Stygiobacter electus]
MKKIFCIVLWLFITVGLYCQSYYPTKKSNEWDYSLSNSIKKVTVLADTLFPNGKYYAVLSEPDILYAQYVRTDSQFVYYYDLNQNKEIPFFKLTGKVGDVTEVRFRNYGNVTITKMDSTLVFNEKVHLISYFIGGMATIKVTLSDKYGMISTEIYADPPAPWPEITYNLIGCKINGQTYGKLVSVKRPGAVPTETKLFQNYPNPFNHITKITFQMPNESKVVFKIYDLIGNEIATLFNEVVSAGFHEILFDGSKIASGVYFYSLVTNNNIITKKLALIK